MKGKWLRALGVNFEDDGDFKKRRQMVFLEQEFTVGSMLNSFVTKDINDSLSAISDFSEDSVPETCSDSGRISSHDGS